MVTYLGFRVYRDHGLEFRVAEKIVLGLLSGSAECTGLRTGSGL